MKEIQDKISSLSLMARSFSDSVLVFTSASDTSLRFAAEMLVVSNSPKIDPL